MIVNSTDRICILRSAFLGDWITTIPFLIYLIDECKIPVENISIVIINNSGINPVSMILGSNSKLAKNTYVINSVNFKSLIGSSLVARKGINRKVDRIICLPFTFDGYLSIIKKYFLSYLFAPVFIKRDGFISSNINSDINCSQYLSYFDKFKINYKIRFNSIQKFLQNESIELFSKFFSENKVVAIYPNSKLKMKIWPLANYIKVIESIALKYNVEFILIGSKIDFEYNQEIIYKLSKSVIVQNLAGVLDIPQTIKFLSKVDLLIANDGAPIHLAALSNTPIVGIYTYKEPNGSWDPALSENYIIIKTDVSCKNCFKDNCLNPVCIEYINPSFVIDACEKLLENNLKHRENRILIPNVPISKIDNLNLDLYE